MHSQWSFWLSQPNLSYAPQQNSCSPYGLAEQMTPTDSIPIQSEFMPLQNDLLSMENFISPAQNDYVSPIQNAYMSPAQSLDFHEGLIEQSSIASSVSPHYFETSPVNHKPYTGLSMTYTDLQAELPLVGPLNDFDLYMGQQEMSLPNLQPQLQQQQPTVLMGARNRHSFPGHSLSLDIQPCISVTEPTPIKRTSASEMDSIDQLINQCDIDMGQSYQQAQYQQQSSFPLLQPNQGTNAWLNWTPLRGNSPVSSEISMEISSAYYPSPKPFFHSSPEPNFALEVTSNVPSFNTSDTKERCMNSHSRSRRVSEPPRLPEQWSPSSLEKPRRAHSARRSRKDCSGANTPVIFPCLHSGCNKVFTRLYNLTSHARTHTLDRPFACNHCGRCFARQHDRNRHEKLHWGVKPYACNVCSKAFVRMDALNRHLRVENGCRQALEASVTV